MIENLIRIYPCKETDLDILHKCASEDSHAVIQPSYIILKGDQLVGYLGVVPSLIVWLDSQRVMMRDSLAVMNFWENQITALEGAEKIVGVNCTLDSPLFKFLPKVGYIDSKSSVFLKNLRR